MGQRVERGGQAARAHLRGAGTGADLIHVEEGVVGDQGRGLGENVGHSPLLRWAEFGGVNNERVIGTSEDEARDVAAGRSYIAFDKESEGRSR